MGQEREARLVNVFIDFWWAPVQFSSHCSDCSVFTQRNQLVQHPTDISKSKPWKVNHETLTNERDDLKNQLDATNKEIENRKKKTTSEHIQTIEERDKEI